MKFVSAVVALAVATAPQGALAVSSQASAAAWLRAHDGAPNQDELAELKSVNPSAYAIVKALLTKRSLGLLDPKHPSASFAPAQAPPQEEEQGASAFQKIAEESGEKPHAAALYPEAPAPVAHHNWLNWRPSQSAVDDEAMVNNVLGQVAALKGGAAPAQAAPAVADAAPADPAPAAAAPVAPVAAAVAPVPASKPVATMNQENSYLKGLDLGGESSVKKEESVKQVDTSKNFLASFSWGDDAARPAAPATVAPHAAAAPKKKNALLDWLSPDSNRVQRKAAPTTAKPLEENSYLKGLDLA